jgi:hypothetical protein
MAGTIPDPLMKKLLLTCAVALFLSAQSASAATCVNRFVHRSERQMQVVTLLTGKYTFQEAQAMAKNAKLEWLGDDGKTIARQIGELKVVRPMPVGCDGKTSGVVLIATFGSNRPPSKKMLVKFDANTTVAFDQQAD